MSSPELTDAPQGADDGAASLATLLQQSYMQLVAVGAFIGAAGAMFASFNARVAERRALWFPAPSAVPSPPPFQSGAIVGAFVGLFVGIGIGVMTSMGPDGRIGGRSWPRLLIGVLGGVAIGALLGGAGAAMADLLGPAAAAWVARWPLFAVKDLRQSLPPLIGGALGGLLTAVLVGVAARLLARSASPSPAAAATGRRGRGRSVLTAIAVSDGGRAPGALARAAASDSAGGRAPGSPGSGSMELTIGEFTLSLDSARRLWQPLLLAGLALAASTFMQYRQQERQHPERRRSLRQQKAVLNPRMARVECLAFSATGRILAAGGGPVSWANMGPGRITLWEMPRGREIGTLTAHGREVIDLALTPDGRALVSVSGDSVRLWEVASGRALATFLPPAKYTGFSSADVSPDGRLLAVGSNSRVLGGRIHLWELPTLKKRPDLLAPVGSAVGPVRFSPDGRTLAVGSKHQVHLWDLPHRKKAGVLPGRRYWVHRLAFSSDGRRLASVSDDPTATVWDVAARKARATLRHGAQVSTVALSPDGTTLLTARYDQRILYRWDLKTGRALARLEHWVPGSRGESPGVKAIAFAPDGRTFASGNDQGVIVWDTTVSGGR